MTPRLCTLAAMMSMLMLGTIETVYAEQISVTSVAKVVSITPGKPQEIGFLFLQPLEIVPQSFVLVKDRGTNLVYAKVKSWDGPHRTLQVETVRIYPEAGPVQLSRNYDLVVRVQERIERKPEPPKTEPPKTEPPKPAPANAMAPVSSPDRNYFVDLSYGDPISEQFLNIHGGYRANEFVSGYVGYGYYSESSAAASVALSDLVSGVRAFVPGKPVSPFLGAAVNFLKVTAKQPGSERTFSYHPLGVAVGGEWQGIAGIRLGAAYTLFFNRGTLTDANWAPSVLSFRLGWAW